MFKDMLFLMKGAEFYWCTWCACKISSYSNLRIHLDKHEKKLLHSYKTYFLPDWLEDAYKNLHHNLTAKDDVHIKHDLCADCYFPFEDHPFCKDHAIYVCFRWT